MTGRGSCAKTPLASTGWTSSTPSMAADAGGEARGHRVGALGVAAPELARAEQGLELGAEEAHLRGELHALLADQDSKSRAEPGIEEDDRVADEAAVLGRPERDDVGLDADRRASRAGRRERRRRSTSRAPSTCMSIPIPWASSASARSSSTE